MGFDVFLSGNDGKTKYCVEITEDYEDDKWHVVFFRLPYDSSPVAFSSRSASRTGSPEWVETVGLNTEKEVFDLLRLYQEEEY